MSEFFAKLLNLSYELFGVILPGFIVSLILLLVWVALDQVIDVLSAGAVPPFSMHELKGFLDALSVVSGISVIVPLLVIWYFLGNILLWIVRGGKSLDESKSTGLRRLRLTLAMRIPKPANSYDPELKPLLPAVYGAFKLKEEDEANWRVLYPLAKSYLSRNLTNSLVSTYQNKYTFHRSVAAAGSVLFWLASFAVLASLTVQLFGGPSANWLLLVVLLAASVAIAWGFSGSYMFHWKMFGNTIITETYSLINGPDHVAPNESKSAGN